MLRWPLQLVTKHSYQDTRPPKGIQLYREVDQVRPNPAVAPVAPVAPAVPVALAGLNQSSARVRTYGRGAACTQQ